MNRSVAIAARIREVLLNGKWIANTNYKEQLASVSWDQAIQKIDNLNTIALLTFHVNYYLAGLIKAFETGRLEISDKYSFDLPGISSEAEWKKLLSTFLENSEKFARIVEQMEERVLDEPFIDKKYGTTIRNIEAVIEHCYYHLGQISLIAKMIRNRSAAIKDGN